MIGKNTANKPIIYNKFHIFVGKILVKKENDL